VDVVFFFRSTITTLVAAVWSGPAGLNVVACGFTRPDCTSCNDIAVPVSAPARGTSIVSHFGVTQTIAVEVAIHVQSSLGIRRRDVELVLEVEIEDVEVVLEIEVVLDIEVEDVELRKMRLVGTGIEFNERPFRING
jgi:hypothetical protein